MNKRLWLGFLLTSCTTLASRVQAKPLDGTFDCDMQVRALVVKKDVVQLSPISKSYGCPPRPPVLHDRKVFEILGAQALSQPQ